MRIEYKKVFDDVDMAASLNSAIIDTSHLALISVHLTNSGDATTGVVKLQGSNDNGLTWVDILNATKNVTTAGTYGFQTADLAFKTARVNYVQAGGTGKINAWLFGKGF